MQANKSPAFSSRRTNCRSASASAPGTTSLLCVGTATLILLLCAGCRDRDTTAAHASPHTQQTASVHEQPADTSSSHSANTQQPATSPQTPIAMSNGHSKDLDPSTSRHSAEERARLQQELSPTQFEVVCNEATEPPFRNAYWDNKEPGIYIDIVSGKPLFSSLDKFDSGSGWPSFTQPLLAEEVIERTDTSHGMVRTEVRSRSGKAHLGHVFTDGPGPQGLRYCINSASLRFIPVADLVKEGYGEYLKLFEQ